MSADQTSASEALQHLRSVRDQDGSPLHICEQLHWDPQPYLPGIVDVPFGYWLALLLLDALSTLLRSEYLRKTFL